MIGDCAVPLSVEALVEALVWGTYLHIGEYPLWIDPHYLFLPTVELKQQDANLCLNHDTLQTSIQDKKLEESNETI